MALSDDPRRAQSADDADLDREQQRLGNVGPFQRRGVDATVDQFDDRPPQSGT